MGTQATEAASTALKEQRQAAQAKAASAAAAVAASAGVDLAEVKQLRRQFSTLAFGGGTGGVGSDPKRVFELLDKCAASGPVSCLHVMPARLFRRCQTRFTTELWCLGLRDRSGALDFKEFRLAVRKEGKINKDSMSDAQLRSVSTVPSFSVLLPSSESGSAPRCLLWQEAVPCDRPGRRRHDRRGRAACIPGAGGGAGRDAHHTQDRVAHKCADQAKEDRLVSPDTTTTQQ